jgi:putative transposase
MLKVQRWFARRPRYHLHFTPTSASWLTQVERFFGLLTDRRIRRGTFGSVRELESAIRDYLAHQNQNPKPFTWTADAESILKKIARLCMLTSDSGR